MWTLHYIEREARNKPEAGGWLQVSAERKNKVRE